MNFAHSEVATLDPNTMRTLCEEYVANNYIDPETSERLGVKRGLRNPDGTGVLAGLTNVCDVVGYKKDQEGHVIPTPGKLIYRGVNINEIVDEAYRNDRFVFEEVIWLLLFGSLPNREQLDDFCEILAEHRALPEGFMDTMNAPSPNIMNKLQRCVLGLYSYDEHAEDLSLENILSQSINLIASMPTMMVNAYQMKRRYYDKQSMFFHMPKPGQSTAEHILSTYRPDQKFTHEEAKLLDMCLLVHADHGGGNCSTFTARVLSSSGTDTYSAIAAAIGALKGPKHGGANLMVNRQLQDILKHVEHPEDDDEVREYLRRILRKQAGDGSGLIYGMGHAVYTMSDPREVILKERAKHLAYEKGFEEEYNMLCSIERLAPDIFAEEKGSSKPVCANVDLFSGLIYNMLGISEDIYTPLFAIARVPGWCAHRVEEVVFANRIIRPAYKLVISDCTGNILREYNTRNTYVTNAVVDGNVIRLKRLKRVSGAWKKASDDSIMNQKNTAAQAIKLTTRITDKALTEKYISLPAGYVMQSLPKTHATKSVMITEDTTFHLKEEDTNATKKYYIYAYGGITGSYADASKAITLADEQMGVVMDSDSHIIWERGGKFLSKEIAGITYPSGNISTIKASTQMLLQAAQVTTTVSEESTTEETTTTTSASVLPDTNVGDVNLDGKVDLLDAICLNKYLAQLITLTPIAIANANCDQKDGTEKVDEDDTTVLMKFVLGFEDVKDLPYVG